MVCRNQLIFLQNFIKSGPIYYPRVYFVRKFYELIDNIYKTFWKACTDCEVWKAHTDCNKNPTWDKCRFSIFLHAGVNFSSLCLYLTSCSKTSVCVLPHRILSLCSSWTLASLPWTHPKRLAKVFNLSVCVNTLISYGLCKKAHWGQLSFQRETALPAHLFYWPEIPASCQKCYCWIN